MARLVVTASRDHLEWLISNDGDVASDWVERCVELREYLVLEDDGRAIGFLRWSWFWGKVPYMDMVQITPSSRGSGAGRLLYRHWEEAMRKRGARLVMTSCERDELGPFGWHEKNGFEVVGEARFPGIQESKELFLAKQLG